LGDALREAEATGVKHPSAILAIWLLAFTGPRRNEILTLDWSAVDLDRAELVLRESKTGPKRIPLPTHAVQLLAATLRIAGNPWERIRERTGHFDVRMNNLRHTHAATGVSTGPAPRRDAPRARKHPRRNTRGVIY
jgi:integrase